MSTLLKVAVLAGISAVATAGTASSLGIEPWDEADPDALLANVVPGESNVLLDDLGVSQLEGYSGSQIRLTRDAKVIYTFLGFEAGYVNYFVAGTSLFGTETFAPGNRLSDLGGLARFTQEAKAGLLDFRFITNGGANGIVNGGANAGAGGSSGAPSPSFFASVVGDPEALSGQAIYLLLDDLGAGPDNDFDDMVVRVEIAPVPLPAGGLLLGTALAAFGIARSRKA